MTAKPFDNAVRLGTRFLYVDDREAEHWFEREPIDLPVMEIIFVRQPDGKHWQLVLTRRIKLRDGEMFALPYGKRWVFAEDRSYVGVWARRVTKKFLKEQGVL